MKLLAIRLFYWEKSRSTMARLPTWLLAGGSALAAGNHRLLTEAIARRRFRAVVALHQQLAIEFLDLLLGFLVLVAQPCDLLLQTLNIILRLLGESIADLF